MAECPPSPVPPPMPRDEDDAGEVSGGDASAPVAGAEGQRQDEDADASILSLGDFNFRMEELFRSAQLVLAELSGWLALPFSQVTCRRMDELAWMMDELEQLHTAHMWALERNIAIREAAQLAREAAWLAREAALLARLEAAACGADPDCDERE